MVGMCVGQDDGGGVQGRESTEPVFPAVDEDHGIALDDPEHRMPSVALALDVDVSARPEKRERHTLCGLAG